jgi:hypothetical protein
VIQDNNMYGSGTIGHGTLWNSQADALVKADPNRFEYMTARITGKTLISYRRVSL